MNHPSRHVWAWPSRRPTSLGGCVARSGLPERAGVLVRGVEDDSLAEAAGIDGGDLIVSAGGKPVADADDLFEALGTLKLPFEVMLVRGTEERTVSVG